MASYLVEGGPSKEHAQTKAMMFGAPDVWDALMRKIAGISAAYLEVQVAAGASAVQLFDSWAGALTPADYEAYVQPHSAAVLARAGALGVPRIHFGVGTANLLGLMGEAGADVVGVDWRTPLEHRHRPGRRPRRAGQPRPDAGLRADRGDDRSAPPRSSRPAAPPAATSSTSGTACCRRTDPDQLKRLTEFVQSYPL